MVRIDPRRSNRTPRAGQRGALLAITSLIAGVLVASCGDAGSNPPPDPNAPQYGVRDSAGGGNGIRSHGFIRVQGVPQRTITPPLIVS